MSCIRRFIDTAAALGLVAMSTTALQPGAPAASNSRLPRITLATAAEPVGVSGSAYGYYLKMSLFRGPPAVRGPKPTVALPPGGSTPITATAARAAAIAGPATIFTSGPVNVSTQGTTGPNRSVTSSTSIANVDASGQESFGYGPMDISTLYPKNPNGLTTNIASTCTASGNGVTGSTTVTNGQLETDNGFDPLNNGTYIGVPGSGAHPPVRVTVPTNPTPNLTYEGHIHIGPNPDFPPDNWRYVFNEQVVNPDGGITVYAAHEYLIGPSAVGDLYLGKVTCSPTSHVAADFTGDGKADFSVFRPEDGSWLVRNGTNASWGTTGDVPVPGDYDADGTADYAVFRPSDSVWYVHASSGPAADIAVPWGTAGDVPVPADYNGDGKTDIAVYRPSTGAWYVLGGPSGSWGAGSDVPVPGDYDGDGKADFAVFRPASGAWYIQGVDPALHPESAWGAPTDVPVPGDYNGDGKTDIAVYRPSTGVWYVLGGTDTAWGAPGDIPQPGDYNGDGKTDIAVYRPTTGAWERADGGSSSWGQPGDEPLVLPYAIRKPYFP